MRTSKRLDTIPMNPLYQGEEAKEIGVTRARSAANGWSAVWSDEHAGFYYHNSASGVSTWERPDGFVH